MLECEADLVLKPVSVTQSRENSAAFSHNLGVATAGLWADVPGFCWLGSSPDSGLVAPVSRAAFP